MTRSGGWKDDEIFWLDAMLNTTIMPTHPLRPFQPIPFSPQPSPSSHSSQTPPASSPLARQISIPIIPSHRSTQHSDTNINISDQALPHTIKDLARIRLTNEENVSPLHISICSPPKTPPMPNSQPSPGILSAQEPAYDLILRSVAFGPTVQCSHRPSLEHQRLM